MSVNGQNLFPQLVPRVGKVPAALHEIKSHSEQYSLPTRLIKMGRGGKRVRIFFQIQVHSKLMFAGRRSRRRRWTRSRSRRGWWGTTR